MMILSTVEPDFLRLRLSDNGILALDAEGVLWGMGGNAQGQLGDGTSIDRPDFVRIMDDVTSFASFSDSWDGGSSGFAIRADNTLWAWGRNISGMLGDGTAQNNRFTPVKILDDVAAIYGYTFGSSGFMHAYALRLDGTLYAWGLNDYGQLGNGLGGYGIEAESRPDRVTTPQRVLSLSDVVAVHAGGNHSLAITSNDSVWFWGLTTHWDGRIFDIVPDGGRHLTPVQIMDNVSLPN